MSEANLIDFRQTTNRSSRTKGGVLGLRYYPVTGIFASCAKFGLSPSDLNTWCTGAWPRSDQVTRSSLGFRGQSNARSAIFIDGDIKPFHGCSDLFGQFKRLVKFHHVDASNLKVFVFISFIIVFGFIILRFMLLIMHINSQCIWLLMVVWHCKMVCVIIINGLSVDQIVYQSKYRLALLWRFLCW